MKHRYSHIMSSVSLSLFFFFFNDTATTEIYTLSLHDALPIWAAFRSDYDWRHDLGCSVISKDRKSTRLNSSHLYISYAVFCLKKKKQSMTCVLCSSREELCARRVVAAAHG